MDNLQMRLELQCAIQQRINAFMQEFNVSPAMMDDALSKVLLDIRSLALQEFLISAQMASSNQDIEKEENDDSSSYEDTEK